MKSASYFLIIVIPPLIILTNFYYLFFNFGIWQKLFQKSGVYQTFTKEEADQKAKNVIEFYENKNALDKNFFSNQAILHLTDVKRVLYLSLAYFALLSFVSLTIFAVLIIKKKTRFLLHSITTSGAITAVFLISLALGLSQAFDQFFLIFHKAVFTNNLWMFPPDDNLVKLFPQEFFVSFANRLALQIVLSSVLISIFAYIVRKKLYDSA